MTIFSLHCLYHYYFCYLFHISSAFLTFIAFSCVLTDSSREIGPINIQLINWSTLSERKDSLVILICFSFLKGFFLFVAALVELCSFMNFQVANITGH